MKVLYIAPFLDGTGYSQAACNTAIAMSEAGLDVVCRPVKYNNQVVKPNDKVMALLDKEMVVPDVCVQTSLPHLMHTTSAFPCVAHFFPETLESVSMMGWHKYLNRFDRVVTTTSMVYDHPKQVTIPISFDVNNITSYEEPEIKKKLCGKYIFYWVGEFSKRKNLAALIKAFYSEFMPYEPVELFIKTNVPGAPSPEDAKKLVWEYIESIQQGMKLYKSPTFYKPIYLAIGTMTQNDLYALYSHLDCFVCTSYAEAWCLPVMEAMAHGSLTIVPDYFQTQFPDWISTSNSIICRTYKTPAFGALDTFWELYSSRETFYEVDIFELRRAMRLAFSDRKYGKEIANKGIDTIFKFNMEKVGNMWKNLLEDVVDKRHL